MPYKILDRSPMLKVGTVNIVEQSVRAPSRLIDVFLNIFGEESVLISGRQQMAPCVGYST